MNDVFHINMLHHQNHLRRQSQLEYSQHYHYRRHLNGGEEKWYFVVVNAHHSYWSQSFTRGGKPTLFCTCRGKKDSNLYLITNRNILSPRARWLNSLQLFHWRSSGHLIYHRSRRNLGIKPFQLTLILIRIIAEWSPTGVFPPTLANWIETSALGAGLPSCGIKRDEPDPFLKGKRSATGKMILISGTPMTALAETPTKSPIPVTFRSTATSKPDGSFKYAPQNLTIQLLSNSLMSLVVSRTAVWRNFANSSVREPTLWLDDVQWE